MSQRPGEQGRPWEGPSEVPYTWGEPAPPPLPTPQGAQPPAEVVPGQVAPLPQYGSANLPARRESEEIWSVFGDVVRKGRWSASRRSSFYQLFGDVKLDLREVLQPGETLEVTSWSMFGDVRIAVPPGTDVEVNGGTVFGDVRAETTPQGQAPRTGARLVVHVNSVFGEVRVREIAAGAQPPRGWRWLRVR
ncbi:LiaF domain-containing protein [Ornithinimicrobium pratense]|uniref:Cell wall-active antibiotics response protein n=1 Tax=Ornithinimicrobium pratense TaxID=2593973 RepID=A0A5J6V768_9MICO|nr:LiaF domain-containing protein [Ornithinimicrobium pratense]QFG69900.1 cell wall-active antibiotics response protein [Ornithinimicrobium pratense]